MGTTILNGSVANYMLGWTFNAAAGGQRALYDTVAMLRDGQTGGTMSLPGVEDQPVVWEVDGGFLVNDADIEFPFMPTGSYDGVRVFRAAQSSQATRVALDDLLPVVNGDTIRIPAGDLRWDLYGDTGITVSAYARLAMLESIGDVALPTPPFGADRWRGLADDTDTELAVTGYERLEGHSSGSFAHDLDDPTTVRYYVLFEEEVGGNRMVQAQLPADKVFPTGGTFRPVLTNIDVSGAA